jgi:hypothetical protein
MDLDFGSSKNDPFAADDVEEDVLGDVAGVNGAQYVHVRIQQRNGRKSLTTIQVKNYYNNFFY